MDEHLIPASAIREWKRQGDSTMLSTQNTPTELESAAEQLPSLASVIYAHRERIDNNLSDHIADLAVEIAGAFLRDHALDHGLAKATALAELRHLNDPENTFLKVSVQDFPQIQAALRDTCPAICVRADETLAPGDCLIESPKTRVDARLSRRLEQVRRELIAFQNSDPW